MESSGVVVRLLTNMDEGRYAPHCGAQGYNYLVDTRQLSLFGGASGAPLIV